MASVQVKTIPLEKYVDAPPPQALPQPAESEGTSASIAQKTYTQIAKNDLRTSLRASTLDGVFAAIFHNIAGGVLLSNFLVELDAGPFAVGLLTSIPLMANLLQPLGAHFSERTTSRHQYCLWIYGISRLPWLLLVVGIGLASWGRMNPHQLVIWTLSILVATYFLGALGSASWMSWMAALVPQRLRGRYFGIRNSAASLTNLIAIPMAGLAVASWPGGTLQGYGIVLAFGILAGFLSLGFQFLITDVNPQIQNAAPTEDEHNQIAGSGSIELTAKEILQPKAEIANQGRPAKDGIGVLQNPNFLTFLLYFGLWTLAANLSTPFLNFYMLDTLAIDVRWVTLYSGLMSGAHLLMMILWGKLADRIGNRPILLLVGILAGLLPVFWLGTDGSLLSIWLWLPLLNILRGGTWAALELCSSNIQLEIAPVRHQSVYFAIAAAVTGVGGALGTTIGGLLAEFADFGGIPGLFVLSAALRLVALLPLVFVQEQRSQSIMRSLSQFLSPVKRRLYQLSS